MAADCLLAKVWLVWSVHPAELSRESVRAANKWSAKYRALVLVSQISSPFLEMIRVRKEMAHVINLQWESLKCQHKLNCQSVTLKEWKLCLWQMWQTTTPPSKQAQTRLPETAELIQIKIVTPCLCKTVTMVGLVPWYDCLQLPWQWHKAKWHNLAVWIAHAYKHRCVKNLVFLWH